MTIVPLREPNSRRCKGDADLATGPAASVAPQVLVCATSPLAVMLAMFNVAVPGLTICTVLGALVTPTGWSAKIILVQDRPAAASGVTVPVPAKVMAWGLFEALPLIVTAPLRGPIPLAANITLTTQFAPGGRFPRQEVVPMASPLAPTLEIVSVAVPLLVSVTDCGWLVVPGVDPEISASWTID